MGMSVITANQKASYGTAIAHGTHPRFLLRRHLLLRRRMARISASTTAKRFAGGSHAVGKNHSKLPEPALASSPGDNIVDLKIVNLSDQRTKKAPSPVWPVAVSVWEHTGKMSGSQPHRAPASRWKLTRRIKLSSHHQMGTRHDNAVPLVDNAHKILHKRKKRR